MSNVLGIAIYPILLWKAVFFISNAIMEINNVTLVDPMKLKYWIVFLIIVVPLEILCRILINRMSVPEDYYK